MKNCFHLFATAVLLCVFTAQAHAENAIQQRAFSRREQRILFRVCESVDSDDRARCQAKQVERSRNTWRHGKPTGAHDLYDRLDRGQSRLRRTLQRERAVNLRRHWSQNRKTFSELSDKEPKSEEVNQRRDYVQTLRQKQLQCMLQPHGRPRRLCFDKLNHEGRQISKTNSGSRQWPAR